jgi:PhzF family phenazine biosynthesis protein
MHIPIYQVDAFTGTVFRGNPAAVCPLTEWLPDATLQSIAAENNLSETAYFVKQGERYELRWMTPRVEVDLCGHATLASAYVIFRYVEPGLQSVAFNTRSGELIVHRDGDLLEMDFPARPPAQVELSPLLEKALGGEVLETWAAQDYMVVYGSEEEIRALKPDMALLEKVDRFAVIVTATGRDVDFVSRFFAPGKGIPEDPVTGRAHCTLTPFWAARYGKTKLRAKQVSERGGDLTCQLAGDRVKIAGRAALFLEGRICL